MQNYHEWLNHLSRVIFSGELTSPRGIPCHELLGRSLQFDMQHPAILIKERKLSVKLLFAEAHWILSGSNKLKDIAPYCPRMAEFSDDGRILAGAYGPRFRAQVGYVVKALRRDRWTRQAVMTMWGRNPPRSKDIPCTISAQFLIRPGSDNDYLHVVINMRSSDAWLGLPYDIFSFSMMAQFIRLCLWRTLPVKIGILYLNVGSSHVYGSDIRKAEELISGKRTYGKYLDIGLYDLDTTDDLLAYLRNNKDCPPRTF